MILGRDIHPERKLYYTGSLILVTLKEVRSSRLAYFKLFENVHKKYGLSINMFTLTLDWLFLLGVVKHTNGEVEKCF